MACPRVTSRQTSKPHARLARSGLRILRKIKAASLASSFHHMDRTEKTMNNEARCLWVAAGALTATLCGAMAAADPDLEQEASNPANWAAQAGDDANHRWSDLKQIDSSNVGKLQVAGTLSTGTLRGHEGSPLVIGDTMYVHAPFPNTVCALDLSQDGKTLWKYEPKQDPNVIPVMGCDTVNRGVAYGD